MTRYHGLSLIEVLVSLALSIGLLAVLTQVYLTGKAALRWQAELSRMEENGRHALGLLSRELRMAGFFGREALASLPPPEAGGPACADAPGWVLDPRMPIELLDDFSGGEARFTSTARLLCLPESSLIPGADALVVKRTSALPSLAAPPGDAHRALRPARWYLLTHPEVSARMTYVDDGGHSTQSVPAGAAWWELQTHVFYLRSYSLTRGDGIPTLCDAQLGSVMRSVCLVEGVEQMQFEFAIDTDGDGRPDTLLSAPTDEQLSRASSVYVHLIARSLQALRRQSQPQSLRLGTRMIDLPADRYVRRVFSATVPLHNIVAQASTHELH